MISRRRLLTATGTAAIVGSAGCSNVADLIAGLALGDVNLFNETAAAVPGTIEVVDPDGETVLQETFELAAPSEDDQDDGDDVASFDEVWDAAGTYEASVTLDVEVQGESEVSDSVTIDDPDEDMLAAVFGADEFDEGIVLTTGEEWSDFERG